MFNPIDRRPIIALDVDGVLLDCDDAFRIVGSEVMGRELVRLNNLYDLNERYGLTQEETDHIWLVMLEHPDGWGGMPVLHGAIEAFLRLQEMGYAIHLVTAVSDDIKDMRLACLAAHGLVPDGIHCVGHYKASKVAVIKMLKPIMMVDDRLHHLHDVPFVEHRVWVDHGDDQGDHVVDESLYHVKSLAQWVRSWDAIVPVANIDRQPEKTF